MSDSNVAGDPVEPHVRPLCRKRCGIALGPLQDAHRIFVVIPSARFGMWRKEYKRERADLCSNLGSEVVLGIVCASYSLVNASTPSKDSAHERLRRFALQKCDMSSAKGFVEYPHLSVAPLQVPFEVEEGPSESYILRRLPLDAYRRVGCV